ncbi:20S-pre-rRNA D-site endonuclease nob1 [Coemansia sp. Benny D115]|nr:20S-pre-rRNA D-site endonuclease nob1 [Coemansia sp. Benny D115]
MSEALATEPAPVAQQQDQQPAPHTDSALSAEPSAEPSAEQPPATTAQPKKKKNKKKSKGLTIDQNNGKPVVTLIVDTNPFIKGLSLDSIATNFVTIPEVVQELRSRASKERFQALDYKCGVDILQPDEESLKAVCDFAKKTGDFASLALADLKVIALAFMMEKKANGMRHLRLEPVGNQPNISDRKLLESAEVAGDSRFGVMEEPSNQQPTKQSVESAPVASAETKMQELAVDSHKEDKPKPTEDAPAVVPAAENVEPVEPAAENNSSADPPTVSSVIQSVADDSFEVGSDEDEFEDGLEAENTPEGVQGDEEDDGWQVARPKAKKRVENSDDFFNGDWITPQNVHKHQANNVMGLKGAQVQQSQKVLKVACVTSDFAMQNVILKMGIRLISPDGVLVNRLRTWVLRCHACGYLTGDMRKQFCNSCGHATLKRCAVSIGANGRLQVHLKANFNYNLRGTIYSLPKAHGGKHTTQDVITRADDKAYVRAMKYKERLESKSNAGLSGVNSLMDPDFIPGLFLNNPLSDNKGYGVATDARGMPMVARNRKNPNANKRTGNRKNKRKDN